MTLWTCNVTDRLLIVLIVCTRWSSGILSGIGNFVFRLWSAGGLDLNICPGVPEFLVTPPVVLQWFSSYLYGRTFKSSMDWGSTSSAVYIPCSIPQGSVLGPPHLFILCSVHGVSWRPRDGINMSSVSTRSPTTRRRRDVCHCTTRELHRGSQPLDVCQPSQVERGWNVAALGRVTSWSGSAGKRWSVLAAWDWNGRSEWPSPCP